MRLLSALGVSFLLFCSCPGWAQNTDAEKISALIDALSNKADDSGKVVALNELSFLLSRTQPQNARVYADMSIDLSRKLNFRKGLVGALDDRALCCNIIGDTALARVSATECLSVAREVGDTLGQVKALTRLGYIAYISGRRKEIPREYAVDALSLARASGNRQALAIAYMYVGFTLDKRGEFDIAVQADSLAIQLFAELHDKYSVAGSMHNLAMGYGEIGKNGTKAHIDSAVLQILKEFGDTEYYGLTSGTLSSVLFSLRQYNAALVHCREAIRVNTKIGNKATLGSDYEDAALICYRMRQYPEAQTYIQSAIDIESELGNKMNLWLCKRLKNRIARHL